MAHGQRRSVDDDKAICGKNGDQLSNRAQLARSGTRTKSEETFFPSGRTLGDTGNGSRNGTTKAWAEGEQESLKIERLKAFILTLPLTTLRQYAKLPTAPGIYFVLSESGELVYIGHSCNMRRRFKSSTHQVKIHFQGEARRSVKVYWLEMSNKSEQERKALERVLVVALSPPLNRHHTQNGKQPGLAHRVISYDAREA